MLFLFRKILTWDHSDLPITCGVLGLRHWVSETHQRFANKVSYIRPLLAAFLIPPALPAVTDPPRQNLAFTTLYILGRAKT